MTEFKTISFIPTPNEHLYVHSLRSWLQLRELLKLKVHSCSRFAQETAHTAWKVVNVPFQKQTLLVSCYKVPRANLLSGLTVMNLASALFFCVSVSRSAIWVVQGCLCHRGCDCVLLSVVLVYKHTLNKCMLLSACSSVLLTPGCQ